MSDLSRHRPYLIWGAVMVALSVVAVLVLVPTGAWIALDERRSSTRVSPDGVAAWARSLERLGVSGEPRFRSFTDDPPRGGGLVVLEPVVPPTAAEAHAALEWVRSGGTLVYAPTPDALLADSLGIGLRLRAADPSEIVAARDSLLPHAWSGGAPGGGPGGGLGGGLAGPTHSAWRLEADSIREEAWTPLSVVGESGTTLAWLPEGEGGALLLADAEEITNRTLDASVPAIALTRAVVDEIADGDTLFFSEFHQALDGRRGIFRETYVLIRGTPWGRAVLHATLVATLILLLGGRRFGSPLPESDAERRSTLEHVEALARIYEAAHSRGTVARHLVRGAARRMGAPHPSGPDPESAILRAWQNRPDIAKPATDALAALHAVPPDLVGLEAALDTITTGHAHPTPRP